MISACAYCRIFWWTLIGAVLFFISFTALWKADSRITESSDGTAAAAGCGSVNRQKKRPYDWTTGQGNSNIADVFVILTIT